MRRVGLKTRTPKKWHPPRAAPAMKIVVCTFASKAYAGSAAVLRFSALREGGADAVRVFTEDDVAEWFGAHPALSKDARGYGFWSWKPWCIRRALEGLAHGDAVVYCDAAMIFERDVRPLAEATEHATLFRLTGQGLTHRRYTKVETMALMKAEAHVDDQQVNAAIQIWRNTPEARGLLATYEAWCGMPAAVDDSRDPAAQDPAFVDHRHDQSILGLLAAANPGVAAVGDDVTNHAGAPDFLVDHHRRTLDPVPVAVITPTVGGPYLRQCIASVQAQDMPNVRHYVVVDGPRHLAAVERVVAEFRDRNPLTVVPMPWPTGRDGWNGHR